MTDAPFVVQMDLQLADQLLEGLISQGFSITNPAYTIFQAKKKGVSCTLFTSGKLVVQGKEKRPFIEFFLEIELD